MIPGRMWRVLRRRLAGGGGARLGAGGDGRGDGRGDDGLGGGGDDSGDDGLAFILVVVVIASIMAVLAATLFHVALDNISTSQRMVLQEQALQAAEAGVDVAYQGIEAVTLASSTTGRHHVPCAPATSPLSGSLGSAPTLSSYTVTLRYYKYATSTHPTPSSLAAASCTTTPVDLVRILVTATGRDLTQTAHVSSQANIAPVSPFANSVFVNGSMTLRGSNSSIGGQTVYVHTGNLTCNGGGTIYGSVTVLGNMTASGSCSIAGALEATTSISLGGKASIGGTVISTTGSISVQGTGVTVSGSMYAPGSITISSTQWSDNYVATHTVTGIDVSYTINPLETALVRPINEPWPDLTWTSVNWTAMHYKVVTTGTTCTTTAKSMVRTAVLFAKAAGTTGYVGIALHTSCPVKFTTITKKLVLAQSLAVFSTAGITVASNAQILDSSTARRTLFLVVPTGTSCTGTNGDISIHGTIGTGVSTLVYSPCKVTVQGTSPIKEGKIYAKTLTMNGNMTLGTVTFTLAGFSTTQVSVGIDFERQTS